MARQSWLDAATQTPLIEQYAQQLESFTETMKDGVVSDDELNAQEARITALMKKIEPKLNDELHAEVTQLLCELTAYDLMQVIHSMGGPKPASRLSL